MDQDSYNNFINELKNKYGEYYLFLATKEEQAEFIRYFALVSHIPESVAKEQVEKIILIQRNSMYYKPYLTYAKSLEERLGTYYFVKLNSNERDKLIDLYTNYMKIKVKGYTKEMAFMDIYHAEEEKYLRIKFEAEDSLKNLRNIIDGKQIGIEEILKKTIN